VAVIGMAAVGLGGRNDERSRWRRGGPGSPCRRVGVGCRGPGGRGGFGVGSVERRVRGCEGRLVGGEGEGYWMGFHLLGRVGCLMVCPRGAVVRCGMS